MFLVLAAIDTPFHYAGPLHAGQTLTIRDVNGIVRVRTGDRFSISATKRAERSDPNAVAVRVDQRADGIIVCVRYPADANRRCDETSSAGGGDNDTTVAFDVVVPRGIVVDAATVNGSVDVVNDGPTDAAAVNGSVRVRARDVRRAATVNGAIDLTVIGPRVRSARREDGERLDFGEIACPEPASRWTRAR